MHFYRNIYINYFIKIEKISRVGERAMSDWTLLSGPRNPNTPMALETNHCQGLDLLVFLSLAVNKGIIPSAFLTDLF